MKRGFFTVYKSLNSGVWSTRRRVILSCGVILIGIFLNVSPSSAKILKTKNLHFGAVSGLPLTVGMGFESQTDSEANEYGFPILIEWAFTDALILTVEPNYVLINLKPGGSVRGWGDLETSINYEFLTETRRRPGFAAEGLIKWPTATDQRLGSGKADFTLGGLASKELGPVELEASANFTVLGSSPGIRQQNRMEVSLASEWHLNPVFDLEGELVTNFGAGGFTGKPGAISGYGSAGLSEDSGQEVEGTLGVAQNMGEHLKLEEGMVIVSDGSWQMVVAFEWDFQGNR